MAQAKRRVSYVIPPPTTPVPQLSLPPRGTSRLGSIGPLLIPAKGAHDDRSKYIAPQAKEHPRHRLGVASLALDTSTRLAARSSPEGILYSGGRDGLVLSWDLGIQMKRRTSPSNPSLSRPVARWEMMTGWGDDVIDEENEEDSERPQSDGDVLGDVTGGLHRRRRARTAASSTDDQIQYEQQWETDIEAFKPSVHSHFRQCAQLHTDWVNDILLCNYNQTLVSASSDGTVKAWNPHSAEANEPSLLGSHSDYVRCLTNCREQNWVASGSFDRTIKLWDLSRSSSNVEANGVPPSSSPLITLNPIDTSAPKSSIYALAADPYGHIIASGSPERVIRLWDPRSGKRTGKLVGHTDNIRSILISEDSRYLLTGSADASIKLWSLSSQRCLHTFTHHTESVWSLHSTHPSFEIFYSGDRSGLVCKVDVENCSDLSEGECVLVCQDQNDQMQGFTAEGINKIVAMDDNLLWTASGNSSIKRWRVPQRRAVRASFLVSDAEGDRAASDEAASPVATKSPTNPASDGATPTSGLGRHNSISPSLLSLSSDHWLPQREREGESTLYGIPFESLVRLTSPNDPFTHYTASSRGRDPDVATLYSAASVMSVPRNGSSRPPYQSGARGSGSPIRSAQTVETLHPQNNARLDYEVRELAADATPLSNTPDDVIVGDHGLVRSVTLNDRMHALTVDTAGEVAVWDIVRGVCKGKFSKEDIASASHKGSGSSVSAGDRNGHRAAGQKERSPREALEAVRERIEGEAVVAPWSTVATKTGVLTVDMNEKCFDSEVYADEVGFAGDRHFNDESRLNIGKWVLRNIFTGFIHEEKRLQRNRNAGAQQDDVLTTELRRASGSSESTSSSPPQSSMHIPPELPSRHSSFSRVVVQAPKMVPAVVPNVTKPIQASPLITPMIPLHVLANKDKDSTLPSIPGSPAINNNSSDVTPVPTGRRLRAGTLDNQNQTPSSTPKDGDYFSARTRQGSVSATATTGGAPPTPDDFSGWGGPGKTPAADAGVPAPLTPGGLMGRMMKGFGKGTVRKLTGDNTNGSPVIGAPPTPAEPLLVAEPEEIAQDAVVKKTPAQTLLAGPFNTPTSVDAPRNPFPQHTPVVISEDGSPSRNMVYRGTVGSTGQDIRALEDVMPMWLLEYLLLNKVPDIPLTKLSFVLLPWVKDPTVEQLPELLNPAQSKLTASRFLRVRKLVIHVQDKIDKINASQKGTSSPRTSSEGGGSVLKPLPTRPKAEDIYEILCNDVLLPLDMCIAAVRQYVWRQAGELVMHYRKKMPKQPLQDDGSRPS
ncbi:hypothetical protein EYR36_000577 [Pleurotus pulmonarius]|nr:hypothetical protein EYR36_000577 [Pleurotus pulmonarius]